MTHRTQLYLDEGQYRWLKGRAGERGSIAAVVRDLIDAARTTSRSSLAGDPLVSYLKDEPAADGGTPSTVETLDRDLYG